MNEALRQATEIQARLCRQAGSPTYEAVLLALIDRPHSAAARLLADDGGDPQSTALHLRLLGAVHRLALTEPDCPLRRWYPSTGGAVDPDAAVPAFFDTVEAHADRLAVDMQAPVQTNEVGRAAVLSAALNWAVDRLGGPVRLLEVGASAGLNLWLDRYRVVAPGTAWGPPGSPVQLVGQFASGTPPSPTVTVVDRRGCDRRPLDLADPATRLLLRSFVWPEHVERLGRLDAAVAAADPVAVDEADAVPWITAQLADLPADVTTVVFHSVVMQYLSAEDRAHFAAAVRGAARPGRRLAWIAMEPRPDYAHMVVSAEVWPPGERHHLATCTPHGSEVSWDPTTPSRPPAV